LLALFLAGSSSASGLTYGKGKKPKTEVGKEKDSEKSIGEKGEDEKTKEEHSVSVKADQVVDQVSDSSSTSVNKYNFILYFIYKYKYGERAESLRNLLD